MTAAYKWLAAGQRSPMGTGSWTPGVPRSVRAEVLIPCRTGIHYCRRDQLVGWINAELWTFEDLAPAETIVDHDDKMVTRKGRIVERVEAWNETTARLFAADCAEHVLHLFERVRPDDDRPRKAIEAARAFARGELAAAAWAAARAAAGAAAGAAAWDAAGVAAWAASWAAARDAAGVAAGTAARVAAWAAAGDAAWVAAGDAAGIAARVAARDAERQWQTERLLDYLEGRAE